MGSFYMFKLIGVSVFLFSLIFHFLMFFIEFFLQTFLLILRSDKEGSSLMSWVSLGFGQQKWQGCFL